MRVSLKKTQKIKPLKKIPDSPGLSGKILDR
jgi:hypothetical protein